MDADLRGHGNRREPVPVAPQMREVITCKVLELVSRLFLVFAFDAGENQGASRYIELGKLHNITAQQRLHLLEPPLLEANHGNLRSVGGQCAWLLTTHPHVHRFFSMLFSLSKASLEERAH